MTPAYRWLNPPPEAAQRIKDRRAAMFKLRRCKNYNAPHGSSLEAALMRSAGYRAPDGPEDDNDDGAGTAVSTPKRPSRGPSGAASSHIEAQYRAVQSAQVIAKPTDSSQAGKAHPSCPASTVSNRFGVPPDSPTSDPKAGRRRGELPGVVGELQAGRETQNSSPSNARRGNPCC